MKTYTKEIAQIDIIESNSMVESIIKQLKYYHIYPKNYNTPIDFINDVDHIVNAQRNRPLAVLNGLSPIEVLNGYIPDQNSFATEIGVSRKARLVSNRNGCGVCE